MPWQAIIGISRLKFLTFTLVTLLLSFSWQQWQQLPLPGDKLLLVSLLALCAHIAVNAWNEYLDFRSGLDLTTTRTPFSGGSGTLPQSPHLAPLALGIALSTTAVVALGGIWLCLETGWSLAWFGLPGLALILFYTGPVNRLPWLCLIAPGLGFGGVIWAGSIMALQGQVPTAAWWLAAVVMLMANNLLLLNQLPDVEADRAVGRRHLAIVYGSNIALKVFALQWLLVYVLIAVAILFGHIPLAAASVFFSLFLVLKMSQQLNSLEQPINALGINVALVHLVPLLLAAGNFFDHFWR
ncbi:MAG TPA: 1,4-dihydroxy-2-naphthoate prenyltransferase [Rheinheimera sp.]|nr:1,4-dihydroxy-2-naphthoate prenyltransferase [Rheinheimera sp.]